jgi:sugar/nucleoside kinase (ribokinase family)
MLNESRPGTLDLLVVGGLTVDRFADGSSAPGGSVLHATRAAAQRGLHIGVATAAGPEPEAQAGLAELRDLAQLLEVASHGTTSTFRHRDSAAGRRLWLEQAGGPIALDADAYGRIRTHAILYAPVADEIDHTALRIWDDIWVRGAILQGWLRSTAVGEETTHVPVSSLPTQLLGALATMDLLVASREDLVAAAPTPFEHLTVLRETLGRTPILVVTDGADGLWIDHPGVRADLDWRTHLPAPWVVDGPPMVGAGDILAAFLMVRGRSPQDGWRAHAERAMRVVAEELEGRKRT